MTRTGTVVRDASGALKVSVTRPAECEHCGMCEERKLLLDLPKGDWREGDTVEIAMPADKLLRASALAYLLPLAMLFAGLLLGAPVGKEIGLNSETASIILGVGLMALSLIIVKLLAPRLDKKGALNMEMTPCGRDADALSKLKPDDKHE